MRDFYCLFVFSLNRKSRVSNTARFAQNSFRLDCCLPRSPLRAGSPAATGGRWWARPSSRPAAATAPAPATLDFQKKNYNGRGRNGQKVRGRSKYEMGGGWIFELIRTFKRQRRSKKRLLQQGAAVQGVITEIFEVRFFFSKRKKNMSHRPWVEQT
jgi:hypothetical protein